jgi:tetratricopeptide (TPR) repeat protein
MPTLETTMTTEADRVVDELAASEPARRRLAALLAAELGERRESSFWQRARPFLAGLSSAAVVLVAFLVPSMQDQWDRYKTREAIDRYAQVGRDLLQNERYESAEQAFSRALELAGNQRLDLLEGQLRARVMRVYDAPEWRAQTDETITEADFIYLLELESAKERPAARASTIGAYGVYLAGLKRWAEAEKNLKESAALDPKSAAPHIHLGNLYDDLGRSAEAEAQYRLAIALNPREPNAHYNLGLLLNATGRTALATAEFALSMQLAPEDASSRIALIEALESQGQTDAALAQAQAAQKIAPDNAEISALLKRLRERPH